MNDLAGHEIAEGQQHDPRHQGQHDTDIDEESGGGSLPGDEVFVTGVQQAAQGHHHPRTLHPPTILAVEKTPFARFDFGIDLLLSPLRLMAPHHQAAKHADGSSNQMQD